MSSAAKPKKAPKAKKAVAAEFPFPYLRHGPWSASQYMRHVHWLVLFESEVPEAERERIRGSGPGPLDLLSWSGDRVLNLSTDQDGGASIWEAYSGQGPLPENAEELDFELTKEHISAFCEDVDRWLMNQHQSHPIGLVVGISGKTDKWHRWSVKQFPERLLPMFELFFSEVAGPVPKEMNTDSQEWGMAVVLSDSVTAYFELLDVVGQPYPAEIVQRIFKLFARAKGYSLADRHLEFLERAVRHQLGTP
jgi:hypothetical protein